MTNIPSPIYSIYLISNLVNNKKYVGFTSKKPNSRWERHCRDKKSLVSKAIQKHGKENFKFEVILQGWDREHVLEMETYFIKEYNTMSKYGYNQTLGQNVTLGYKHTKESIEKIRQASLKYKATPETIEKLRMLNIGHKNPMYGKELSKEHRQKISMSMLNKNTKTYIITHPNGKVETIINLKRFCIAHNICDSKMVAVSKGKIKHHKGFIAQKL